jgi:hypothetical protein
VFRRDCFKPNCATTLFNQRDSALESGSGFTSMLAYVGARSLLYGPLTHDDSSSASCFFVRFWTGHRMR